jgi:hypothetical protein
MAKKTAGYSMNPGSKENDTPGTFSIKDFNKIAEMYERSAAKINPTSAVTGGTVDVGASLDVIRGSGKTGKQMLGDLITLHENVAARPKGEMEKDLGKLSVLLK